MQLSDKEIASLSEAQFKTLVTRILTELVEYGCKIEEKLNDMKNEIKENVQGTKSEGKETRTQINILDQKEEISFQPEKNEERIQKNEERLRNLWDNFKCSNTQVIQVPERGDEKQEIENLFEKIMMENSPSLAKEIDFQEVQEAQRVPKKLDPRKHTPRHIIITLPKMKDKEKILKVTREKETITYKGVPTRLSADFSKETLQAKKELERSIQSHERQGPTSKFTLSSKAIL